MRPHYGMDCEALTLFIPDNDVVSNFWDQEKTILTIALACEILKTKPLLCTKLYEMRGEYSLLFPPNIEPLGLTSAYIISHNQGVSLI